MRLKNPNFGHQYVYFLSKQIKPTQSEKQQQAQQRNEWVVENIPKSRLKCSLVKNRSFDSKLVVDGDENK